MRNWNSGDQERFDELNDGLSAALSNIGTHLGQIGPDDELDPLAQAGLEEATQETLRITFELREFLNPGGDAEEA
jgi:hypothetical protein